MSRSRPWLQGSVLSSPTVSVRSSSVETLVATTPDCSHVISLTESLAGLSVSDEGAPSEASSSSEVCGVAKTLEDYMVPSLILRDMHGPGRQEGPSRIPRLARVGLFSWKQPCGLKELRIHYPAVIGTRRTPRWDPYRLPPCGHRRHFGDCHDYDDLTDNLQSFSSWCADQRALGSTTPWTFTRPRRDHFRPAMTAKAHSRYLERFLPALNTEFDLVTF